MRATGGKAFEQMGAKILALEKSARMCPGASHYTHPLLQMNFWSCSFIRKPIRRDAGPFLQPERRKDILETTAKKIPAHDRTPE